MSDKVNLCHCGKKQKVKKFRNDVGKLKYYIECCYIKTIGFTQARSAIRAWNNRFALPHIEGLKETIDEVKKFEASGNLGGWDTQSPLMQAAKAYADLMEVKDDIR